MNFLNETVHPNTLGLTATLVEGADSYEGLETWRKVKGLSDEKAADLYARIEEAFDSKPINSISVQTAGSMISKALWQNERIYP